MTVHLFLPNQMARQFDDLEWAERPFWRTIWQINYVPLPGSPRETRSGKRRTINARAFWKRQPTQCGADGLHERSNCAH